MKPDDKHAIAEASGAGTARRRPRLLRTASAMMGNRLGAFARLRPASSLTHGAGVRQLLQALGMGPPVNGAAALSALCEALLSRRGDTSGPLIARELLDLYSVSSGHDRYAFLAKISELYGPDTARVDAAIAAYGRLGGPQQLRDLHTASESRRHRLIRLLNLAPDGTRRLIAMRADIAGAREAGHLIDDLDADFSQVFSSWFNAGFLDIRHIDWRTPSSILQRIIEHEAVHSIMDWDDMRRRVEPPDRRCYAFFHPRLADDPLIFVEVALTTEVPNSIAAILETTRTPISADLATTVVFYSISACQTGLRGIAFGDFLIKRVVDLLRAELPRLTCFVTLSPVPGLTRWMKARDQEPPSSNAPELAALAADYLLDGKTPDGQVLDPVARFHLHNGARLQKIHLQADLSEKGLRESCGVMVNYLYERKHIEKNHVAFTERGEVAASRGVRALAREATGKEAAL